MDNKLDNKLITYLSTGPRAQCALRMYKIISCRIFRPDIAARLVILSLHNPVARAARTLAGR